MLKQSSPMEKLSLSGKSSVMIDGDEFEVSHYRLRSYAQTRVNGRTIRSPFSGELYFCSDEPQFIPSDLIMKYQGAEILLKDCKISGWLEKVREDVDKLKFGIEFSYATVKESNNPEEK